jgi:hypothetical protein
MDGVDATTFRPSQAFLGCARVDVMHPAVVHVYSGGAALPKIWCPGKD